jgi:hypothetical protein
MEIEYNRTNPFLYVPVIRKGPALTTMVDRKPNHTSFYLNSESNHPCQVKRGVVQSLFNTAATTTCQK